MTDFRDLYQEVIIDHGRHPRNFGALAQHTHEKEGFNPLCGDKITIYLILKDNVIDQIQFEGCGCAISMASSSLMTQLVLHKTIDEVMHLFEEFQEMVLKDGEGADLDKCQILAGVKQYPARVKCATLAWHTLRSALAQDGKTVSTE